MRLQFYPFEPKDLPDCLEIYDSVEKDYFIPENRVEFIEFFNRYHDPFFIGRLDGAPAACGGYYFKTPKLAVLTWGIVHARCQHQGLGTELLKVRTEAARASGAEQIEIHTSQLTEGFYLKFGFERTLRIENGFGAGIDEVHMRKII